jgi:hypothetical protein
MLNYTYQGQMAERSKACDSRDPLRAFKARAFTYRKMRGFESPSVHFIFALWGRK